MRGTCKGLRWLAASLLMAIGCATADKPPKPMPLPEEVILPPNEPRFSQAPTFPAKTLNQDMIRKDRDKDDPFAGSPRGSSRVGMGGPGGY